MSEQPRQTGAYDSSPLSLRAERVVEEARQLTARIMVRIGHAQTEDIVALLSTALEAAEALGCRKASERVQAWADRNDDPGDVTVQDLLDELDGLLASQEAAPSAPPRFSDADLRRLCDCGHDRGDHKLRAPEPCGACGCDGFNLQEGSPR